MFWYSVYFPGLPLRRAVFFSNNLCEVQNRDCRDEKKKTQKTIHETPKHKETARISPKFIFDWYLYVCFKSDSRIFQSHTDVSIGDEGLKCLICCLARKDLYRATPAMTKNIGLQGLIHRTYPVYSPLTANTTYSWPVLFESPRMPIF